VVTHHGRIFLESVIEQGTKFTINFFGGGTILPEEPRNNTTGPAPALTSSPHDNSRQWIVIEDDEMFLNEWNDIFKKCKFPKPLEVKNPYYLLSLNLDWKSFGGAIVDYDFEHCELTGTQAIEFLKKKGLKKIYLCSGCYTCDTTMAEMKTLEIPVIPKPLPNNVERIFI